MQYIENLQIKKVDKCYIHVIIVLSNETGRQPCQGENDYGNLNTKINNNCKIIRDGSYVTVVSYQSPIIEINNGEIVKVHPEWTYSRTTSRHLNMALNQLGYGHIAEMTREQKRKHFNALDLI